MGRLTNRYDNGRAYICVKTKAKGHEGTAEANTKAINRLAELKKFADNFSLDKLLKLFEREHWYKIVYIGEFTPLYEKKV